MSTWTPASTPSAPICTWTPRPRWRANTAAAVSIHWFRHIDGSCRRSSYGARIKALPIRRSLEVSTLKMSRFTSRRYLAIHYVTSHAVQLIHSLRYVGRRTNPCSDLIHAAEKRGRHVIGPSATILQPVDGRIAMMHGPECNACNDRLRDATMSSAGRHRVLADWAQEYGKRNKHLIKTIDIDDSTAEL